jgi:multicomponent Na+:H+ antiporter subunit D
MAEALMSPAVLLIFGAGLVPFLRDVPRRLYMAALPIAGLILLWQLPFGNGGELTMFGLPLETLRIDRLSFVFGVIFHIAALLIVIYSWHFDDAVQQVASLIYAGAAIGAVLAGDLVTMLMYWELATLSSVFLIWARRTERAYHAGMRYLIVQVGAGVLILAGIVVRHVATGSVDFERMTLSDPGAAFILLGIGVKCAFPLLHGWLQDAYPEATIAGTVALSAFTTKLAVYALTRGFPGTELLIYIGAAMTVFPIFYAVIENDLRRVLAYSLINQLGFMVVGVGIGTELALNGTVSHAFAHILYKALLFMAMGAVLLRAGTVNASELGGLYKSMPQTAVLCMIGAASISAFPLFSGFVTKSLVMGAAAQDHLTVIWLLLLFASAGVFHHAGIKVPYFAFFAHDSGIRCTEAPVGMRLAMGLTAALCIGIGVYPQVLYGLLPYPVEYVPYTTAHVVNQLQLLLFAALAFTVLIRAGWYPPEQRGVNLDFDWVYRHAGPAVWQRIVTVLRALRDAARLVVQSAVRLINRLLRPVQPEGLLALTWSTSTTVGWIALLLGLYLVLYLF